MYICIHMYCLCIWYDFLDNLHWNTSLSWIKSQPFNAPKPWDLSSSVFRSLGSFCRHDEALGSFGPRRSSGNMVLIAERWWQAGILWLWPLADTLRKMPDFFYGTGDAWGALQKKWGSNGSNGSNGSCFFLGLQRLWFSIAKLLICDWGPNWLGIPVTGSWTILTIYLLVMTNIAMENYHL